MPFPAAGIGTKSVRTCSGRSVDPPEYPPSSYRDRISVQPGMGLALDVGGSGIVLSIQRIELLVESMFRGDAGVDGTADGPDRRSLHDRAPASNRSSLSLRPKKRGPFHLVPVIAKATLDRLW